MISDFSSAKLSRRRLRQIKIYMSDRRALNAALAGVLSRKKHTPRARKLAQGDIVTIRKGILDLFSHLPPDVRKRLHEKICHQYDFCKTRQDTALCLMALPTIAAIVNAYAIPFSVLVAVLVYRPMNIFCDCDDDGPLDKLGTAIVQKMLKSDSKKD